MTARIRHSYYVVMIDYGRDVTKAHGLEAVVNPELTRRQIVARIKSGDYEMIEFIHYVDGLLVEDVTDELIDEAEFELKEEARELRATPGDLVMNALHQANARQAAAWDHARDLRKHEAN